MIYLKRVGQRYCGRHYLGFMQMKAVSANLLNTQELIKHGSKTMITNKMGSLWSEICSYGLVFESKNYIWFDNHYYCMHVERMYVAILNGSSYFSASFALFFLKVFISKCLFYWYWCCRRKNFEPTCMNDKFPFYLLFVDLNIVNLKNSVNLSIIKVVW